MGKQNKIQKKSSKNSKARNSSKKNKNLKKQSKLIFKIEKQPKPAKQKLTYSSTSVEDITQCNSEEEAQKYYQEHNIQKALIYGRQFIKNFIEQEETTKRSSDFLTKHKISKETRKSIIDYLYCFIVDHEFDIKSYFVATNIFDTYLDKKEPTEYSELDLEVFAFSSLLLTSKLECVFPLFPEMFCQNQDEYTPETLEIGEKEIFQTLNFALPLSTVHDIISTLFCDFLNSSLKCKQFLKEFDKYLEIFKNCCDFLSEFILLDDSLCSYSKFQIAIACLATGFELISSNSKKIDEKVLDCFRNWVYSLIQAFNSSINNVPEICKIITNLLREENENSVLEKHEVLYD